MKIENFNIAPGANVNIISDSVVTIKRDEKPQIENKQDMTTISKGDFIEPVEIVDDEEKKILDLAKPYIDLAIERGYLEESAAGYEWKLSKVLLAYFCAKIFCGDFVKVNRGDEIWKTEGIGTFPDKILSKLFNSPNLGTSRRKQLLGAAPRGYKTIDALFE